ncbi:type 1 glutamine amidotransferase [Alicyclobacillus fastidiosus]|uniref:Lipid II isoglutaminyl synthase (glutamine-hydrolyzing) subunit GatD n=1 Tax=Alicyclobacillus fastidiosus TaxID=392011 RepID=A0ABV5ADS4_9BACL|nr:glutamine amidotransferase [Alicyclobacillus fastidiosus]WEH08552.1 glutamine amidotransferase [Alicyclobacillus fastidiosus]
MNERTLNIAHLYPDLLNLYADRGNIVTLVQRLRWRGIEATVHEVTHQDAPRLSAYDLVLLGGGSDREQEIVGEYLLKHKQEFKAAVDSGLPLLAICGGYQLLGAFYQLPNGQKIQGLDILDMYTSAGTGLPRLIGNVAIETEYGIVMGFENHGGRTVHQHRPLGKVLHGHGNDGESGYEGVHHMNIWGTYIHGPLLPKNPQFADAVLATALEYAGHSAVLDPLDDVVEESARRAFLARRMPDVTTSPDAATAQPK